MPNRAQRRAAARKQAQWQVPEPGAPFPSLAALSERIAVADRAGNPQPGTAPELVRPNGDFRVLPTEDACGFEAFKQSLIAEHQPSTTTESLLVNIMAESHWLANRALRLQDSCFNLETGQIADPKLFALYLRCQTTHTRAFHRSLHDLLKLRSERRKEQVGFEAQRIKSEQHEMKKQKHYWDVLRKDGEACHQIAQNTLHNLKAAEEHSGFEAQFTADLATHGLERSSFQLASTAA